MSALSDWRDALAEWAIPQEILEAAPESPWGFSPSLFRDLAEQALSEERSPSHRRSAEALPRGGSVLDVGVGAGAASLPLAPPAGRIIGVDGSAEMLVAFRELATRRGVEVGTVHGSWPEVADRVGPADVVVCHHVLYNVADLEPFVGALVEHARRRVVVELTARHPRWTTNPLFLRFHGLVRPEGPTVDDAVAALRELGIEPGREDHPPSGRRARFESREEAIAFVRRSVCLRPDQDRALAEALGGRVRPEPDGRWALEPLPGQRNVTLWWDRQARAGPGQRARRVT